MIEKHISALLYRYQCVTVPGFGAFLTEIRTAQLNADTGTFYPPKKLISFNANVKNNDGLLANHIALQEKISYEQAVSAIGLTVNSWLTKLQSREALILRDLGSIAPNTEGSFVFTPDTPVNYLTDAFGLSAVVSPAVKREVYKQEVEALEEKAPIAFTPERRKRRSYTYLKYAAIFAVTAGVGGTGFKMFYDQKIQQETLAVQQSVQQQVEDRLQQATFFIDNPMPAVKLTVAEENISYPYHIVAGAFRSEENAETARQELIAKGFKAKTLEKNKYGLYPVLYGSFATHKEAQDSMRSIHKTLNREAWLLIKE